MDDVARALARYLETPSAVGPQAERFAETALGLADAAAWEALLADSGNPDRGTLVELLLFPDDALRLTLEPLLWAAPAKPGDEQALAGAVAGGRARFVLPGGAVAEVVLEPGDAAVLASRLRPAFGAPPEVRAALQSLPEEALLPACVRLRLARFAWTPSASWLLGAVARRLGGDGDVLDLLDWCCLLLEIEELDGPSGVDRLRAALMERHARAERRLKDHAAYQQRLAKSNFETMLLAGDRAPHADPHALRRDMVASDRICRAVFGAPAARAPQGRDLGELPRDGQGLSLFMRLDD